MIVDDGVEFELVPIPSSEVAACVWPIVKARVARVGYSYLTVDEAVAVAYINPRSRCYRAHPLECVWNGAQWFCVACNKPVPAIRNSETSHEGRTLWAAALHVGKPDPFYAETTALYRHAAASNSSWGNLHPRLTPWRDGCPVAAPWSIRPRRQIWLRDR